MGVGLIGNFVAVFFVVCLAFNASPAGFVCDCTGFKVAFDVGLVVGFEVGFEADSDGSEPLVAAVVDLGVKGACLGCVIAFCCPEG